MAVQGCEAMMRWMQSCAVQVSEMRVAALARVEFNLRVPRCRWSGRWGGEEEGGGARERGSEGALRGRAAQEGQLGRGGHPHPRPSEGGAEEV